MEISEKYRNLMHYSTLPERFRAGSFALFEEEEKIIKDFIDEFFKSLNKNKFVSIEEFTGLMDFLDISSNANTKKIRDMVTEVFIKSSEIEYSMNKDEELER